MFPDENSVYEAGGHWLNDKIAYWQNRTLKHAQVSHSHENEHQLQQCHEMRSHFHPHMQELDGWNGMGMLD